MSGTVGGLRYADCAAALIVYGLNTPEIWDGLRCCERALIDHYAEEAQQAKNAPKRKTGRRK